MRKFTLPFGTDSDSNKSTHSSQAINESGPDSELPKITKLHILLTDVQKWTTLKVIGDAILLDIKLKLMKAFGGQLTDAQNMGLFQPSEAGKMGKFLEEERLLSEYAGDKNEINLEFVRKRRIRQSGNAISFVTETFPKDVYKAFLRYVSRGDHKKVTSILSKGFDPNFQCPKTGETPLTLTAMRPKPHPMISALIGGGAHRDFCSKAGLTALHKASIAGNYEAVKSLLDFGQSPNSIDRDGLTPLYHNILHDPDTKICHSLLYEHSALGTTNKEGLQEIHQAARLNRVDQINLLIMYSADVNSRCTPSQSLSKVNGCTIVKPAIAATAGDTPLHVAAAAGQRTAVLSLLSWGADPNLVNANNLTAVQVATCCGHGDLAETIRLFRGPSHPNDDPFLPVPTYNPRRRMRRAPANSYITEPTTLSTAPTVLPNSGMPQTSVTNSCGSYTLKPETLHPVIPVEPSLSNAWELQPIQRTVSMGNLMPTVDWGLRRWNENPELFVREPVEHNSGQKAADVKHSSNFAFTNQNQKGSSQVVCDTVGRRLKSSGKMADTHRAPDTRLSAFKGITLANQTIDQQRHFSRLTRPDPTIESVDALNKDPSSPGEFQREGSQTDSGISNSSVEKRSQSPSRPVGARQQPVVNDCRSHTKELSPVDINATGETARMRPSISCIDGKHWHLQHNSTGPDSSFSIAKLHQMHRFLPRTVVLQKAHGKDIDASFGLSLRTAKSPGLVASFQPTEDKPSLQTVIRVVRDMPAYNAGIRDGDFVLKINGIDVTRFSHDEVVNCLSASTSDSVCLTVVRCPGQRSASRPAPCRKVVEQPPKSEQLQPQAPTVSTVHTPPIPPHSGIRGLKFIGSVEACSPVNRFARSPKPPEDSGVSSARSSDRTTCSSFLDEGLGSPSTGPSSTNTSRRNPTGCLPVAVDQMSFVGSRPHSGSKFDSRSSRVCQLRKSGIPRSRTICGIAETTNPDDLSSMARSLYFARNPQFQRIGSQDSRSSVSSSGEAALPEFGHKNFPSTGISGPSLTGNRGPMTSACLPKVTLIRAERNSPRTVTQHNVEVMQQQIRVYPAHRTRRTSIGGTVDTESNPIGDLILLPPPLQFR